MVWILELRNETEHQQLLRRQTRHGQTERYQTHFTIYKYSYPAKTIHIKSGGIETQIIY